MKKIFSLFLFSVLLFTTTIAQNNLPPVYEIKTDTAFQQNLSTEYWQLLEDKNEKWTIGLVSSSPLSEKFHAGSSKTMDTACYTYWVRYRIKNMMGHETKISFDSHSGQDDYYLQKTGDKWDHFVTGYLYPWNKKDGFKQGNYIPDTLHSGEGIIVYQKIHNNSPGIPKSFVIDFVNTEKEMRKEFYEYNNDDQQAYYSMLHLLDACIIGILFVSIFFNLFFYRIVREKVYLYFSLFLLFLCINRTYEITGAYLARERPDLVGYIEYIGFAWMFILFFLIQFFRYFFQIFNKYPKWDKVLYGLGVLFISIQLLRIFYIHFLKSPGTFLKLPSALLFHCIPFFLFITLLLFIRKRGRFNKLVIIGAMPLMFLYGILAIFLNDSGFIIVSWLPDFSQWLAYHFRGVEMICIIWLLLFFSWVLFLRYNQLRKENAQQALEKERLEKEKEIERNQLIAKQKIDLENQVAERTAELKHSLENLQSTQRQLIQSEKMASLGELTAGIAHEIQNPLNFVNNFSEVNQELAEELKGELAIGNRQMAIEIANDIKDNSEKINHHGKRADAIVKGMLQHSRSSTGAKEPTDINALADEYLRLAFHGLRAKDNSFNATMKTDFDNAIGKINIIPQDIGRVLLNLYNNAFYAVNEKKKAADENYESTISVSTKKSGNQISITVSDNGNGIPQKVVDKIFQPFFTTKPTGQGTGLGLSLSYDIIKAHGGEIKVETKEGEFTEFSVILPFKTLNLLYENTCS